MNYKKTHIIPHAEKRNPSNNDSFAYRLIFALKLRRMLAIDICQKAKIGKSTISLYVNGKSMPSKERLVRISESLRVDPAWLLGLTPMQAINRFNDNDPYEEDLNIIKNIFNCPNKQGKNHLVNTAQLLFESKIHLKE